MPGFLLHLGAVVQCAHLGRAMPMAPNPRVLVSGQMTVTIASPFIIVGCALPPPPAANGPCITGQYLTAAMRVTSNAQPLLLQDSQAICAPTGTPLINLVTQMRVIGT